MKIQVRGHNGLFRDKSTNAILNANDKEYQDYIDAKNQKLSEKQELDNLKKELGEIKDLLYKLLKEQS